MSACTAFLLAMISVRTEVPAEEENRERIGITLGTGVGGIQTLVEQEHIVQEKGLRRVSPFAITMIMPNGAAGMIATVSGAILGLACLFGPHRSRVGVGKEEPV